MATKVRGALNEFHGNGIIDGGNPAASSVSVTLQVASVDTRNDQHDHFLRAKYLHAESHPTITFTSRSVSHEGGDNFIFTGDRVGPRDRAATREPGPSL